MMKPPRIPPMYIVQVAKNGCARAAYDEVATFQSNVVIGLNNPNPMLEPVNTASLKLSGAIHVIQLNCESAVNKYPGSQ